MSSPLLAVIPPVYFFRSYIAEFLACAVFLCGLFSSGLAETYPTAYQELSALATPLAPARDCHVESGS